MNFAMPLLDWLKERKRPRIDKRLLVLTALDRARGGTGTDMAATGNRHIRPPIFLRAEGVLNGVESGSYTRPINRGSTLGLILAAKPIEHFTRRLVAKPGRFE